MPNRTEAGVEYLQDRITGVSVVIPCKNEEKAVGMTISNVIQAMEHTQVEYEVIIVDDGSTDGTQREAVAAGARVLVHKKNMGYGNSIMDGMTIAKYPVITIMDADGTYPAEMLPEMIEEANSHDMVIGTRIWTRKNTTFRGRMLRKALYYVILYLSNVKAPDFNSGLRVFRKLNTLDHRAVLCPTFSFTTSQTLLYLMTGRSVKFMPMKYDVRIGKSKVAPLRDALKTFSYVFLMANLFQAYRMALIFIFIAIMANLAIAVMAKLFDFSLGVQIGMYSTIVIGILSSLIALNVQPTTKLYVNRIRGSSRILHKPQQTI
ncbi:MAG: hypothetical protein A2428_16320 [Bdellovibrionales bacterium RIFOXYC1_FULL_54_43]|nr:MAG: hypothetical protein A2428_16320 [Bdellovibrionales bacterium RIFOXYC1_FULL_54_43]OFZ83968.1 MAG: hypothetical protein A2603_10475 [Bdellovibrionales bacterium RIFOXYD1_FULL_55_31]